MRAFVWLLLAAFVNATVAMAGASPLSPPVVLTAAHKRAPRGAGTPPPLPPIPLTTDLPSAIDSQLPDLGSEAYVALPENEQVQIGYAMMLQMRAQNQLLGDPEVEEYLNWIGKRLASQSAQGGAHFNYLCVNTPVVNSFAAPGNFVFINSGLMLFTKTESELAAVMAHETAHETQNHLARKLINAQHANVESLAAMLATILLGAVGGGGGQAIEGGIVASQGLAAQEQIDYSRSVEEEADRVGIEYLAAAGFDPEAMADIFGRMMDLEGVQDAWVPAVLQGHPITRDRIAEAQARAAQYPHAPDTSSPDYYLIKARVRVLTAPADEDVQRHFAEKIAHGDHSLGTMYGDALALTRNHQATRAVKILMNLRRRHPDLHLLYIALGQAQAQAGEMPQALATFKQAMRLFPLNVPVTVRYAETLMADGRNAQAHALLFHLFNIVDPTPGEIQLTARAASAAGDLGDAYYYMGYYQLSLGNVPLAVKQYQIALGMPRLNSVQRARITAALQQAMGYLARMRRHKS